jgi:HlyD family secretion protein
MVTTDEVTVSSEIQGRLEKLLVKEGDTVKQGDLLAVIQPQEMKAEMEFYANGARQSQSQVLQGEADLKYQESQSSNQILQAQANLAASEAQVKQADADLDNAQLNFNRIDGLFKKGIEPAQSDDLARTTLAGAQAHQASLQKLADAAQSAVDLAKSSVDQIAMRRAALDSYRNQLAASTAQSDKAKVRLDYTEIHAPINGIVDVRAALQGEVVSPAQPIVTLINPDDLWVRADVEESYIDRIHLGDKLPVRLASGATYEGTVFYRGVDADYATQRDVSRTKRDIKTFEIRLRCDNSKRELAVGMTTYVTLPSAK